MLLRSLLTKQNPICSTFGRSIMDTHLFLGPIIHTTNDGHLEIIKDGAILVKNEKILQVGVSSSCSDVKADKITRLETGQFLIPGFIDCHIHAVQLPNLGIGYDRELIEWLEKYTFPLERKYSDANFAEKVYDFVVKQTLNAGTTTACYFASMYGKTSVILAKKAVEHQQRAFVGKVNMNAVRKDGYYETTEDSIKSTQDFVENVLNIQSPLVKPIITPRFALSCDMELMKKLSEIAREHDLHIQTHVSENLSEINICKELFPENTTYTSVYEAAGLLTRKTILAHGVHLKDSELVLLKNRGTSVIHCPTSNTCLRSGLCDVKRLKSSGVNVGLGTDVAGGNSLSLLDVMRSAIQVSTHIGFSNEGCEPLNYADVFHLATLGGARALAIEDQVGNFVQGKQFDALVVDANAPNGPLNDLVEWSVEEQLQRFIHSGDDRNIAQVYVAGRRVK